MNDHVTSNQARPHGRRHSSVLRTMIDILGVVGVLIGIYALYDQTVLAPRKAERLNEEIKSKVELESQQQRLLSLSQVYEQRFKEGTIEEETSKAAAILREIQTLASHNPEVDPLRDWVFEEQITQPQYVRVLDEAGLLSRKILNRKNSNQQVIQITVWQVNDSGRLALQRNDFANLKSVMESSLQRAEKIGLPVTHLLYGRYWGVGYVLESTYDHCDVWKYEEAREVEREPPLIGAPPAKDDRIFGRIKIALIAGIAWRSVPIRQLQVVELASEPGSWLAPYPCASTNNIGIRGCPKPGDLVGYVEDVCAEQWEKLTP
jgi:hypothetical protein